jgi:hypothetical protein
MARLYANENFPLPAVEALRKMGHDVQTTADAGQANVAAGDALVLEYAIGEERAVLTLNRRHFIRLHRDRPRHAGVIVRTFNPDFTELARRIDEALAATPLLEGQLLRVSRPG